MRIPVFERCRANMALDPLTSLNLCDILAHLERGPITSLKRNPLFGLDLRSYPILGMAKAPSVIVK